uniref:Uncharacterized protein n=1 Tax=viral metagenome TaxID=1070528 RepID=A0A6C0BWD8_9ZZZZ
MNITFLNFYMSSLRNMFLLSSIAIGLVGFSDRFSYKKRQLVKIFAIGVLLMAILMGNTSTNIFKEIHLKNMNSDELTPSDKIILEQSRIFPLFAYTYSGVLAVLIVTLVLKMLKNLHIK